MTDAVRAQAKRVLRNIPPLRRLITNMASEASRGHRLEVGMRTVGYELRTRLLGRPTVATFSPCRISHQRAARGGDWTAGATDS